MNLKSQRNIHTRFPKFEKVKMFGGEGEDLLTRPLANR